MAWPPARTKTTAFAQSLKQQLLLLADRITEAGAARIAHLPATYPTAARTNLNKYPGDVPVAAAAPRPAKSPSTPRSHGPERALATQPTCRRGCPCGVSVARINGKTTILISCFVVCMPQPAANSSAAATEATGLPVCRLTSRHRVRLRAGRGFRRRRGAWPGVCRSRWRRRRGA